MAAIALLVTGLLVIADQLIKYAVVDKLKPLQTVTVIDGLLDFSYVENRGAAFGMLQNMRWIFIVATVLILGVFVYIFLRYTIKSKWFFTAVVLIASGGIANLIDRIFLGYVVDFISVSFFPPVFNFADCCITVGAVLLIFAVLFIKEPAVKRIKEK